MVGFTKVITESIRQEIFAEIHKEREARIHETNELRKLCEISRKATEDLSGELESERLNRCKKNSELHARLGTEISSIFSHIEVQMTALREQMEEKYVTLKEEIKGECQQRKCELDDIRATLDATSRHMVKHLSFTEEMTTKIDYFQDEVGNSEEFHRDVDDMCTLHNLAKKAMDESARVEAEFSQEQKLRGEQIEKLKCYSKRFDEQFKQFIGKMNEMASYAVPKSSWTLAQLVNEDPQWNLLLVDPDGLFNKDDVIDAAYTKYLSDVLPLMIKHECTFKVAIGLLADSGNANGLEVSSVKSGEESESMEEFAWSPRENMSIVGSEISTDVDIRNLDADQSSRKGL